MVAASKLQVPGPEVKWQSETPLSSAHCRETGRLHSTRVQIYLEEVRLQTTRKDRLYGGRAPAFCHSLSAAVDRTRTCQV